jgi:hypothetical protein
MKERKSLITILFIFVVLISLIFWNDLLYSQHSPTPLPSQPEVVTKSKFDFSDKFTIFLRLTPAYKSYLKRFLKSLSNSTYPNIFDIHYENVYSESIFESDPRNTTNEHNYLFLSHKPLRFIDMLHFFQKPIFYLDADLVILQPPHPLMGTKPWPDYVQSSSYDPQKDRLSSFWMQNFDFGAVNW